MQKPLPPPVPESQWHQGQYENFEVRWTREPDYHGGYHREAGPPMAAPPHPHMRDVSNLKFYFIPQLLNILKRISILWNI